MNTATALLSSLRVPNGGLPSSSNDMKAIRVHSTGGPEVLKLEELPDPSPGPMELLVTVEAIGLNFIEIYFRQGLYPSPLPFIPGSEVAGVVAALGAGGKGFRVGG